jgi:hypothetical protein
MSCYKVHLAVAGGRILRDELGSARPIDLSREDESSATGSWWRMANRPVAGGRILRDELSLSLACTRLGHSPNGFSSELLFVEQLRVGLLGGT